MHLYVCALVLIHCTGIYVYNENRPCAPSEHTDAYEYMYILIILRSNFYPKICCLFVNLTSSLVLFQSLVHILSYLFLQIVADHWHYRAREERESKKKTGIPPSLLFYVTFCQIFDI